MCQPDQTPTRCTVEDLERAAWFARLAFGIAGETEWPAPAPEAKRKSFEVLP